MIAIPQIIAAMIVGVFVYMLAVVLTVYDGLLSVILQPILGAVFTGVAILCLLVAGLPIRRIHKINQWWKAHWWVALVIGSLALLMLWLSWMPQFRIQVFD